MSVVGKNVPHDSARGYVTGEAIYVDDMPFARNELLVDFFWSPVAHGRIRALDTTAAESSGAPSENLTFGRSFNVHCVKSAFASNDCAIRGSYFPDVGL